MNKYFFILIFSFFLSTPFVSFAYNVGFVDSSIWLSKDKVEEGDNISIYTAIWNGEDEGLSGTAYFYNKETFIGKRTFVAPPNTLIDVSIDWVANAGDHSFSVELIETKFSGNETLLLEDSETKDFEIVVSKKIENKANVVSALDAIEKSKTVEKIGDGVDNLGLTILDKLPSDISEKIKTVSLPVEDFRKNRIEMIGEKKTETKKNIESNLLEKKDNEDSSFSSDSVKKPLQYIYLFFLALLSFIYSHALIFYALCAYIVFIVLRFIYRKIKRKDI